MWIIITIEWYNSQWWSRVLWGPRAKIPSPSSQCSLTLWCSQLVSHTKSFHCIVSCTTGKKLLYLHTFTIVKFHLEIKKILRKFFFVYPKHNLEIYFLVILSNLHATKWIKDHLLDRVEILLLHFELQVSYLLKSADLCVRILPSMTPIC